MKQVGGGQDSGSTPDRSTKIFLVEIILMGWPWYRLTYKNEWTTRQAIDVNEAKSINANDEVYFEKLSLAA